MTEVSALSERATLPVAHGTLVLHISSESGDLIVNLLLDNRLTAFVARSFRQAQPYITIEDHVIDDALQWLSANQAVNGSFPEVGKVSHTDMQGGAGKGVPLTAYVLLAFLENKVSCPS